MLKRFLVIALFSVGLFAFVSKAQVIAGTTTNTVLTADHVVDMLASSPQYLGASDLTPLSSVDDATITSGLFAGSISSLQSNFIFKFSPAYNLPSDEEFKSIKLRMVYKMNVGTIGGHYVTVKYFNKDGVRTTCVPKQDLTIPSTQGSYVTQDIDLALCQNESKINTIEVYYFAWGSTLPVNTSFDQVVVLIEHGNKNTSGGGSGSGSSTTTSFVKAVDVNRGGGTITREGGVIKLLFGLKSLPYEANIVTSIVTSPLVSKPAGLTGNIYKLDVFASFNGYPLTKFNPSLLFMSYPWCSGRPVIKTSTDGKNWSNLFTLRAVTPANTAVAVIKSPGYYAVTCQ